MISPSQQQGSDDPMTKYYDFHGIFRLALHSNQVAAIQEFQAEYAAFEVPFSDPVDLYVTVGSFPLSSNGRTFGNYLFANDWIYGRERYKVASWQFALQGLEEPTTHLLFHGGIFSLYFLQHFYVEPIMHYKISRKGYVMVHGGCVSNHGVAVLFPALGQVGKTALALQQTLAGWQFQSDDYTFLSAAGMTYSYPRRLHLSDHIHDVCPAATQALSRKRKLSIKSKKLVYYLTLKYGDLSESLALHELVPNAQVAAVARLGAVLSLTGSPGAELIGPLPIGMDRLVNRVMAINSVEGKPFYNVLLGCQYHRDVAALSEWWEREREILQLAFRRIVSREAIVPRSAPDRVAVLEGLARMMDKVLEESFHGIPA